jgi:hypothetical protein
LTAGRHNRWRAPELDFVFEDVADKLSLDYAEVYGRMKAVGMIDDYVIPHYDVLHTESRANVTAGMIETLKRWEGQK